MRTSIEEKFKTLQDEYTHVAAKYLMMQADYEARLKADLEAILVDLKSEIEEMDSGCGWEGYRPTERVIGLIQDKINKLKGDKE